MAALIEPAVEPASVEPSLDKEPALPGNGAQAMSLVAAGERVEEAGVLEQAAARVPAPVSAAEDGHDSSYELTGKRLWGVYIAMLLATLLMALDQTILATALPRIASDFDAFTLQGWISSAFVLVQTPFLLICAQVLRIWPSKWILFHTIVIFEIGSAVCGAATSVYVLIFGRGLSGLGAAGMFIGSYQVITQVTKLEDRPKLMGGMAAIFGFSQVVGPLTGGAFTDHVSWRWCFYINLPVGAISLLGVGLLVQSAPPLGSKLTEQDWRSRVRQTLRMDWVGGILVFAGVVVLCMAMQWGGNTKPWSSAPVITTLVLTPVIFVATVFWSRYMGERAMVPPAVFHGTLKQVLSTNAIILNAFVIHIVMFIFTYYLPIYYQVSRGYSATKSGLAVLPFLLSATATMVTQGWVASRVHRYWHFLLIGPPVAAIGAGLLYTCDEHTAAGRVIGYQFLCGIGLGITVGNPTVAIQAEFHDRSRLIGQAMGMAAFGQNLGATLGLAFGEAAFSTQLAKNLPRYAPGVDASLITESPTDIYTALPASEIAGAIRAYCKSLDVVFLICVPFLLSAVLLALMITNRSLRTMEAPGAEPAVEKQAGGEIEKADAAKPMFFHA